MLSFSFGYVAIQGRERSLSKTFKISSIDDNLSPELYNSFLDICKNPANNEKRNQFEKLVYEQRSHSFEGTNTLHEKEDNNIDNYDQNELNRNKERDSNYTLLNKSTG